MRRGKVAAINTYLRHGDPQVEAICLCSADLLVTDEVVERSRPRPQEVGMAAAHFELGQHLWREGRRDDAIRNFREAHRLQPDNWTYKRQAWSFVNPLQAPSEEFEGDWLGDVRKIGAENYYPRLEL